MSKRSRREKARRAQAHRQRPARSAHRPARRGAPESGRPPELVDGLSAALDSGSPLPVLGLASAMLTLFEPRLSFGHPAEPDLPDRDELIESFFTVDSRETSGLLAALAGLLGDEVLRRRVRREVSGRGHVLPRWLLEMDGAEPSDTAFELGHVLGDGENLVVGARLAGGDELCAAVYVDHNLGTLVKDAMVVPGSAADLAARLRASNDDPDIALRVLTPADARARITEAIELHRITVPPIETDTWPAARPLLGWMLGLLPEGGIGYGRSEWPDDARRRLAERFLASPHGTGLDDGDARGLVEDLIWFGCDYGPGDPLRWSPTAVEIVLTDWIPRKIVADVPYLAQAPAVLRALVRFAHAERGIRTELTAETLAAVEEFEAEYQETIRSPRPQGPMALLARLGALGPDGVVPDLGELLRARLEPAVGSARALAALDDEPLPDEPLDWSRVPETARERVAEALPLVDAACDALLGVEVRTAARRLLARAAERDPQALRRGRADTTAAAICWIAAKANDLFETGELTVQQLMGRFGVAANTPAQRGRVLLRALGVEPVEIPFGPLELGSADFLTSARRRELITLRDSSVQFRS